MTILDHATVTLPVVEVAGLLLLITCLSVAHFNRVALIVSYLFAYRWGWIYFADHAEKYIIAYLIFGVLAGVLSVIGLIDQGSKKHPHLVRAPELDVEEKRKI